VFASVRSTDYVELQQRERNGQGKAGQFGPDVTSETLGSLTRRTRAVHAHEHRIGPEGTLLEFNASAPSGRSGIGAIFPIQMKGSAITSI